MLLPTESVLQARFNFCMYMIFTAFVVGDLGVEFIPGFDFMYVSSSLWPLLLNHLSCAVLEINRALFGYGGTDTLSQHTTSKPVNNSANTGDPHRSRYIEEKTEAWFVLIGASI